MTATPLHQRTFEILREIASGGFGSVFLARLQQGDGFSRIVAIKLLHPQWSENEEVAKRMRDEARLLGLLRHRNIIDVLDLTRLEGRVAVVMEYLEAIDGKAIIGRLDRQGARLPNTAALQLIAQAASALDAAYNKAPYEGEQPLRVVHRDIKPSNLMVDAQGVVKVLDFGVARGDFAEREAVTKGMAFGSYDYMPSERRFMEPGGETTDVYSLGAVLFELLAGEGLGKGKLKEDEHADWVSGRMGLLRERLQGNPRSLDELCGFIERMLAFDAEARPRPGEVVKVFRRLARAFDDGSLEEWAEVNVPPLLARQRARQDQKAADPLVGHKLIEDRLSTGDGTPQPLGGRGARTDWEEVIPKRVRDAAPARPPITGTVTPAPLRRRRTPTPTPPPRQAPRAPTPGAPPRRPPRRSGRPLFTVALVVAVLTLLGGAAALLAAVALYTAG